MPRNNSTTAGTNRAYDFMNRLELIISFETDVRFAYPLVSHSLFNQPRIRKKNYK